MPDATRGKVLIIERDRAIADTVRAVLTDLDFAVSVLNVLHPDLIRVAVGQLEPDCIILDGATRVAYGHSWDSAAWLHARGRPIPTIMFTTNYAAAQEALDRLSDRSIGAGFSAIIPKPFDLDELIAAVETAVGQSVPFDRSPAAEAERTQALVRRLTDAGMSDIHPSSRREWATCQTPSGSIVQIYWWQRAGVYLVGVYPDRGAPMEGVGQFYDLDAAVQAAVLYRPAAP